MQAQTGTPRVPAEDAQKEAALIQDVVEAGLEFELKPAHSKIIRARMPISRVAISDPSIVEINEFSTTEIEVIGLKSGQTTMTMWFQADNGGVEILRYIVKVGPNEAEQDRAEVEFGQLQNRINALFPNSFVQLIPVADKLIVRGQARDAKEATEIMAVVTGQSVDQAGNTLAPLQFGSVAQIPGAEDLAATSVINLLHVPGEQQVMLKVRIAELNRTAARELGVDFDFLADKLNLQHFIGSGTGNLTAILDGQDVSLFLQAFSSNGTGKLLAEPTLVTVSGTPATFIAGGQFAVPTAVGVDGIGAVTTTFQSFGTQLNFTPTVLDKDKIRLQVSPSFSSLNQQIAVDGIPGLNTRGASTTVDLREGQWLAIAGLIEDEQGGERSRLPVLGSIPVVGAAFGSQRVERRETELVILVSPELVHPMEPDQVPALLPGMEVTDPTNREFFLHLQHEGQPGFDYRSTVWPTMRHQLRHENREVRRARRGRSNVAAESAQSYYMSGPTGLSR